MKRIDAIIQPHKLQDVREALEKIGVGALTVSDVRGPGRQKGHKEIYRGAAYQLDLLPKVKVEIVIPDSRLDETVTTLVEAARTGHIGDGKVFIDSVEEAIRIRNGERGEAALRTTPAEKPHGGTGGGGVNRPYAGFLFLPAPPPDFDNGTFRPPEVPFWASIWLSWCLFSSAAN